MAVFEDLPGHSPGRSSKCVEAARNEPGQLAPDSGATPPQVCRRVTEQVPTVEHQTVLSLVKVIERFPGGTGLESVDLDADAEAVEVEAALDGAGDA
jgi:hypothetical protein